MKVLRTRIHVQGTPEQVWHVLTDFDRYQDWNPFIHRVVGEPGPGGDLIIQCREAGWRATTLHCTITDWQPGKTLGWEWRIGARWMCHGTHTFTIRPQSGAGVLFIQEHLMEGALLNLFAGQLCETCASGVRAMDHALKNRVENAIHNHALLTSWHHQTA